METFSEIRSYGFIHFGQMTAERQDCATGRPMNICYIILVHHKFEQALRLVRCLSGPNTTFVIHVDSLVNNAAYQKFKTSVTTSGRVFFARRERNAWGSYRAVKAIANCINEIVSNDREFARCILLSGQDYPIKAREEILNFFRANPHTEYIEAFPRDANDETVPGWSPYYRFRRIHVWVGERRRPIPVLRRRPPNFSIFHGSQWWALSRDAILYLDDEFRNPGPILKFFRTGFLIDEACIQTLMMLSPFSDRVAGRGITFTEWTPTSGPHPKVLRSNDFEALVASDKLFARKFDADTDSTILDMLDGRYTPQRRFSLPYRPRPR